jgi:ABC-2 type transport system permease protein/lipopolysaccharide transport system permease protein
MSTGFFAPLWRYRLFIAQLVRVQLMLRYRRTTLGFLWTLISPVLTLTISAFVFAHLLRAPDFKIYIIYVFTGMLPWMMFSNSVTIGGGALLANESLLRKVALPLHAFPVAGVLGVMIDNFFALGAMFLIMTFLGASFSPAMLVLPLSYALLLLFSTACAMVFAIVFVYFRDMQHITTVLLQALMYFTPILYRLEDLPGEVRWLFQLNPMYYLLRLFREPMLNGLVPASQTWLAGVLIAVTTFAFARLLSAATRRTLIFRL